MLEITCIMVVKADNNFDDITNITNIDYLCRWELCWILYTCSKRLLDSQDLFGQRCLQGKQGRNRHCSHDHGYYE